MTPEHKQKHLRAAEAARRKAEVLADDLRVKAGRAKTVSKRMELKPDYQRVGMLNTLRVLEQDVADTGICVFDSCEMENELREALASMGAALATSPADQSLHSRDSWIYAIVLGWGDAFDEVAKRHLWTEEIIERLRRYRAAVAQLVDGPIAKGLEFDARRHAALPEYDGDPKQEVSVDCIHDGCANGILETRFYLKYPRTEFDLSRWGARPCNGEVCGDASCRKMLADCGQH